MSGRYNEAPFPQLTAHDFGPNGKYRVQVEHNGQIVVIGNIDGDLGLQNLSSWLTPESDIVDVHIHGLPGRFIEELDGNHEIPVALVAELLESAGIRRGTPLRLITCHGGEPCATGHIAAQMLAEEWMGAVAAPNGRLQVYPSGHMIIDLVDWDNIGGLWFPNITGPDQGSYVTFSP